MMIQLQQQAQRFGTDVRDGWVTKVDFSGPTHKVWVNDEKEIHCDTVIISTGASAKYLGLPSEQHYLKMGGEYRLVQFVMAFSIATKKLLSLEQEILLVKKLTTYRSYVKK